MSAASSIAGAAGQGDTAPAGAMHLGGGNQLDPPGRTGMLFVGEAGSAGLNVSFVDLTAASGVYAEPGGPSLAGAPAFGAALDRAQTGMQAGFTGPGAGVPGGAMLPETTQRQTTQRTGTASMHDAPPRPAGVPLKPGA